MLFVIEGPRAIAIVPVVSVAACASCTLTSRRWGRRWGAVAHSTLLTTHVFYFVRGSVTRCMRPMRFNRTVEVWGRTANAQRPTRHRTCHS